MVCNKKYWASIYEARQSREPILTENAIDNFEFGKLRYIKKGSITAILSYGVTTKLAKELNDEFKKKGQDCSLVSCHTLKPLDVEGIKNILNTHQNNSN